MDVDADTDMAKTCLDHLLEKVMKIDEPKPNATSKLFATIDYLLREAYSCLAYARTNEDKNAIWPCDIEYGGHVKGYYFKGKIVEVSILRDTFNGAIEYAYLCVNFTEAEHVYAVDEISCQWIPNFVNNTLETDKTAITVLKIMLGSVLDRFTKFVEKGKYPAREFCLRGIKPVFTVFKEDIPKKKKKPTSTKAVPYAITEPEVQASKFLRRLTVLYNQHGSNANESSRLFAVILESLRYFYSCLYLVNERWPVAIAYDAEIYQVWFQNLIKEEKVDHKPFNVSLLRNDQEFYLCVRYTVDKCKYIVKKLDPSLVPTLSPNDLWRDLDRIENLNVWLSKIIDKFVKKTLSGSSDKLSFISLSSLSQSQPSTSTSAFSTSAEEEEEDI